MAANDPISAFLQSANTINADGYLFVLEDGREFRLPFGAIDMEKGEDVILKLGDEKVILHLKKKDDGKRKNNEEDVEDEEGIGSWNDASTKLFFNAFVDKKKMKEGRKITTQKKMYEAIAAEMASYGYKFSALQIQNKWKSLLRAYKRFILMNKKTGEKRRTLPYEREMTEILGGAANIFPPMTMGTKTPKNKKDLMDAAGVTLDEDEEENVDDDLQESGTPEPSNVGVASSGSTPGSSVRRRSVQGELRDLGLKREAREDQRDKEKRKRYNEKEERQREKNEEKKERQEKRDEERRDRDMKLLHIKEEQLAQTKIKNELIQKLLASVAK